MRNQEKSKECSFCKAEKPLSNFKLSSSCKDGFRNKCRQCSNKRTQELHATRREEENLKRLLWVKNNKEKRKKIVLDYNNANKEFLRTLRADWRLRNKNKVNISTSKRRKRIKEREANWDKELTDLVTSEAHDLRLRRNKSTNLEWHVDHIIPVNGKLVSGLHVWNNLQVIPAIENMQKGNRAQCGSH